MPGRNSVTRQNSTRAKKVGTLVNKETIDQTVESIPDDEREELNEYIRNGLKLRDKLLVNRAAVAAAKQEYRDEYTRKRQRQ